MNKVVLMSCVSKKLDHRAPAKDLYVSPLFRLSLQYAYTLRAHSIFVLSAEHGLVDLDQELSPYNYTLNTEKDSKIRIWAEKVLAQLRDKASLDNDHFIFLAGEKYRRHIVPHLKCYEVPMQGLTIGRQLSYLSRASK